MPVTLTPGPSRYVLSNPSALRTVNEISSMASTAPDCHRRSWADPSRLITLNSPCSAAGEASASWDAAGPAVEVPAIEVPAVEVFAASPVSRLDALAAAEFTVALPTTSTAITTAAPAVRRQSLLLPELPPGRPVEELTRSPGTSVAGG